MSDTTPAVLFLCTHNAGRSQMALGFFTHLAGDRAVAFSGGSEPGDEVNPVAVQAMAEVGIDITGEFPKPWTDEVVRAADVVVTMGCGDACPFYPGKRYEKWDLPDPAGQGVEAVRPKPSASPRSASCWPRPTRKSRATSSPASPPPSERERVAAKRSLADVTLGRNRRQPAHRPRLGRGQPADPRHASIATAFAPLAALTVGEFREMLLEDSADQQSGRDESICSADSATSGQTPGWAITPEIAAAVAKLMSNKDLVLAASKIRNVTRCRNTMGERGVLGVRVQPNHPADDLGGILLSAVDGLLFGCGDAVIGVNPATESVDTVGRDPARRSTG